ncbi:telomere-protecting terminal protein Tpg [Streptomyces sp. NBC_01795]|uniref:telomere-protecting terminal protein Tpg n=1 Tax=Streptomyces sp. NBC_01795 TaxID=2975943 RepID=UPI003FA34A67
MRARGRPDHRGLNRAAQHAATQPLPKGAPVRMRHLVEHLGGSTRAAAGLLGIARRTVERYMKGEIKTPRKPGLAARLEDELRARWQPGLQRRAIDHAKNNGFTIESYASFGYDAPGGTTDEARMCLITQHIPPATARGILDAYQSGATAQQMEDRLSEALTYHYFRDNGRRAHGLDATIKDIDYMDIDF